MYLKPAINQNLKLILISLWPLKIDVILISYGPKPLIEQETLTIQALSHKNGSISVAFYFLAKFFVGTDVNMWLKGTPII